MNALKIKSTLLAILCLTTVTLVISGCESRKEPASPENHVIKPAQTLDKKVEQPLVEPKLLFAEQIQPVLVETSLEALPVWRDAPGKPTLILMSNDPLLRPIPSSLTSKAVHLAETASMADMQINGARSTANPLVYEDMTLELALKSKFFSKVVWLLPLTTELPFEAFKAQALGTKVMTQEEASSFGEGSNSCFAGVVRGVPMEVCSIDHLPPLQGAAVLHWEMSFFREVYKDEVRTPMYNLLGEIAVKLRKANWPVAAVTINRSSLSRETTLLTRFLADDLGQLVSKPQLLDSQQLPEIWNLKQKAFYTELLFKRDMAIELSQQLVSRSPQDAAAHYLLYHFLLKDNFTKASEHLHAAVRLDSIYALEYLDLIDWALKKGQGGTVLDLIARTRQAFPNDPFVKLQQASYLILAGRGKEALPIIKELQALPWSEAYYSHIPAQLEGMAQQAKSAYNTPSHEQ